MSGAVASGSDSAPDRVRENVATMFAALGPNVPFPLALDRQSVVWVEGYLDRVRTAPNFDATGLVPVLGSFLGQCLVEHHDGSLARICDHFGSLRVTLLVRVRGALSLSGSCIQ